MAEEKKPTDIIKSPQWRIVAAVIIVFAFLYLWTQFFNLGSREQYTITYSQFMEQLDAGNVKSVTIKNLQVSGDFIKAIDIPLQGEKKTTNVKSFQTYLPTFQGEDLLKTLQDKKVDVTVEPSEKGSVLWQILIGVLPWVLIIGVWIFIMKRAQI